MGSVFNRDTNLTYTKSRETRYEGLVILMIWVQKEKSIFNFISCCGLEASEIEVKTGSRLWTKFPLFSSSGNQVENSHTNRDTAGYLV